MRVWRDIEIAQLLAALLLCLCFGSIHAYGVLVAPLEQWLQTSRANASLGYSLAILMLTAGVFVNARIARYFSIRKRVLGSCLFSAAGLALLAWKPSMTTLLAGYGVMFGLANGLAYSVALELSAASMPRRPAVGIGVATAVYGLGSMLSAWALSWLLAQGHQEGLFVVLAIVIALSSFLAAILSKGEAPAAPGDIPAGRMISVRHVVPLWLYYVIVAISGLMIIAHAPSIVIRLSGNTGSAGLAAILVSGGSVIGGTLGGYLAGRWPGWPCLAAPALLQSSVLAALALTSTADYLLPALLAMEGLCYGVIIAVIPAYIRIAFGERAFPDIYGYVFTAWGVAGFLGPLIAGILYDARDSYTLVLLMASILSVLGGVLCLVPGLFPVVRILATNQRGA